MKDKRKEFFELLLVNSEKVGIPKRVIQIYVDQVTNRIEVK
ncbi:hypothetical protein [Sutcliffiella deserti]|nr:hypothetical protein [Sutcliffiella deserti]